MSSSTRAEGKVLSQGFYLFSTGVWPLQGKGIIAPNPPALALLQ